MMSKLSITTDWSPADHGSDEVRQTSGFMRIGVGGQVATRVENLWAQSIVEDKIRLSAYPLAQWLAANWWRLRWEPAPQGEGRPSIEWRMAHEMAAAGQGFLWPPLAFESDGEVIEVVCRPSDGGTGEPIRYLSRFQATIDAADFERTIDTFLGEVLAQLDTSGLQENELRCLWNEVSAERHDPQRSRYRQWEARLGFDPDEGPEDLLHRFLALSSRTGRAALDEIAPACAGKDPAAALTEIAAFAETKGIKGEIKPPPSLIQKIASGDYLGGLPWERGRALARHARAAWNLGLDALSDEDLTNLLAIPKSSLSRDKPSPWHPRMGLAVRKEGAVSLDFHFRRNGRFERRFEASRLMCDHLLAPGDDKWLPTTDTRTARQKAQRAFAAEFLCPIGTLEAFLDGNYGDAGIEDASREFAISPLAIRSHLANNGLLSRHKVEA